MGSSARSGVLCEQQDLPARAGVLPARAGVLQAVVEGAPGGQAGSAARRLNARVMAAAQGQSAGRCSVSWRA